MLYPFEPPPPLYTGMGRRRPRGMGYRRDASKGAGWHEAIRLKADAVLLMVSEPANLYRSLFCNRRTIARPVLTVLRKNRDLKGSGKLGPVP